MHVLFDNFDTCTSKFAGMTVPQAARYHLLKLGLCDDLYGQVNHGINPSVRAVEYMRKQWLSDQHGGLDNLSMADSIRKYAANNPEITILQNIEESRYVVVLVTPFMRRIHSNFREAGEIVFVDATGCVDQLNTSLIPFLCAGPTGAAPLALLFTSSIDEGTLKRGKPDIPRILFSPTLCVCVCVCVCVCAKQNTNKTQMEIRVHNFVCIL